MFKLGFTSTTLRNLDLFQALQEIKGAGYEGVELTLNDTHLHPLSATDARVREVRDFCLDNGIHIECVAAGGPTLLGEVAYEPSFISSDAAGRQRRRDFVKRAMEVTRILGVPTLNINSGLLREDTTREEAATRLREGVDEALREAGDLIVVWEPEPDFFIGTSDAGVDLVRAVNSPQFRLNLDIGHVFCSEENPYEAIEKALPFTRNIHIEDIKGGIHHHEIPGEGDIDFKRIIASIKASGYDHYVAVELHHHDTQWQRALTESRSYLCQLM